MSGSTRTIDRQMNLEVKFWESKKQKKIISYLKVVTDSALSIISRFTHVSFFLVCSRAFLVKNNFLSFRFVAFSKSPRVDGSASTQKWYCEWQRPYASHQRRNASAAAETVCPTCYHMNVSWEIFSWFCRYFCIFCKMDFGLADDFLTHLVSWQFRECNWKAEMFPLS